VTLLNGGTVSPEDGCARGVSSGGEMPPRRWDNWGDAEREDRGNWAG